MSVLNQNARKEYDYFLITTVPENEYLIDVTKYETPEHRVSLEEWSRLKFWVKQKFFIVNVFSFL